MGFRKLNARLDTRIDMNRNGSILKIERYPGDFYVKFNSNSMKFDLYSLNQWNYRSFNNYKIMDAIKYSL